MSNTVFVRLGSHRASDKLTRVLGQAPQTYFSRYHPGNLAEILADRLTDALQIRGIARANVRDPERWHRCWL
jgi:hypothetical protein